MSRYSLLSQLELSCHCWFSASQWILFPLPLHLLCHIHFPEPEDSVVRGVCWVKDMEVSLGDLCRWEQNVERLSPAGNSTKLTSGWWPFVNHSYASGSSYASPQIWNPKVILETVSSTFLSPSHQIITKFFRFHFLISEICLVSFILIMFNFAFPLILKITC